MLVVFIAILSILRQNGIFYGILVICFSPRFGMLYREKFGNPGWWTRPRWPVMDIFRRFREYLL
jgi:hypothetical protein